MDLQQGINFRQTVGFIDDGANEYAEAGLGFSITLTYPTTTAEGNTVGWEQMDAGVTSRDRNNLNDRRLAGVAFCEACGATYRIDIRSPGNKNIRFAAGDNDYGLGAHIEIFDTNISLGILANRTNSGANVYTDAMNMEYSEVDWLKNNSPTLLVFSTSILRFKLFSVAADTTEIAHFYVEDGPDEGSVTMLGMACT
jgi:hypothetical protein